ncbi:MAG TPA: hypothetical protein VF705_09415, partial [Longimicrobium sp.]
MSTMPVLRRLSIPTALLLAACVGVMPVRGGTAAASSSGSGGDGEMAASGETAEVARLVNAHRARIGCRALAWDVAAARAAQAHSDD